MLFPTLKFRERVQVRIGVIKRDHEAQVHLVVLGMVEKASALGVIVQWPSECMYDGARFVLRRVDRPDLLQPDPVVLRVTISA